MGTRRTTTGGIAFVVAACAATAVACKVPVFRYALERWAAGPYHVVVLAAGGMPSTDPRLVGLVGRGRGDRHPATTLEVVDASLPLEGALAAAWAAHGGDAPVAVVLYPRSAPPARDGRAAGSAARAGGVAHVAVLDDLSAATILSSPVRTEIGRHLVAGATAVWVLLETGDAAADTAARETLEAALARDRDALQLPDAEELEIDPGVLDDVRIPLKVDFPLVAVARDDVREAFLVDCLLGSEADLREYDEPIAFPVFGRGVVLHALVGRGISEENVEAAHAFITGACSCVVKEQNPGFDLLLDVDWESAVGDVLVSEPAVRAETPPRPLAIPPGARRR